ncbi:MAG: hypothetical protein OHK0036_04340 [Bacteroidia bacterium]
MKQILQYLTLLIFALTSSSFVNANLTNPELIKDKKVLFKIQRSKDANEVYYTVNVDKNGQLDVHNPIQVFWVKYYKDGTKIEPLTWVQKKFAYGINYIHIDKTYAVFQFVSYPKRQLIVKKSTNGQFNVYVMSNNKWVILEKIFVQIDGGTFWLPNIPKVEIYGRDPAFNLLNIEIIKP